MSEAANSGFFFEPTVIAGAKQTDEIVQKEVFGPVAASGATKAQLATKVCADGRWIVETAKGTEPTAIVVDGSTVRFARCKPATAARRIVGKRTTLRATLDCEARTRVRFVFSADCRSVTADIVAKGSPLRRILGLLSRCGDGQVDADAAADVAATWPVGPLTALVMIVFICAGIWPPVSALSTAATSCDGFPARFTYGVRSMP